jgi:predicted permease
MAPLRRHLQRLLRRRKLDGELQRELELHLEQLTDEFKRSGMSEAEARQAARRAFGSVDDVSEQCRDARRFGLLEDLARDVVHGLRLLRRSPVLTVAAVLSLALGLGANTAIFSLLDAVVLRSLPVERPDQLVFVRATGRLGRGIAPPYPCLQRIQQRSTAFAAVAAFTADELKVEIGGTVEQVFGQVVSGSYFDLLGLRPVLGRLMTVDDERLAAPVAVISHRYWQRRFDGARDVLGRTITYDGRVFSIVGITPAGFYGLDPGRQVDVSIPVTVHPSLTNPLAWSFEAVARLGPGVEVAAATTQAETVFQAYVREHYPGGRPPFDRLDLPPAGRGLNKLRAQFARPLTLLLLAAAVVLLVACANVASLLLARGAERARELAIRVATGASRGRLLRQLLAETLLLFLLGAGLGLCIAHPIIRGVVGLFATGRRPILLEVQIDWRLAGLATGAALATGLVTGLWPALRALRTDPQQAMRPRKEWDWGGRLLVAGQVALCLVALVGAPLFLLTMVNLHGVDLGFRGRKVLTLTVRPTLPASERGPFWRQVLQQVRELPGASRASLSVLTPFSGRHRDTLVSAPGSASRRIHVNHVSEGYFDTIGIGLRAGRDFTPNDDPAAPPVVVLNETAARLLFGEAPALDRSLQFQGSPPHRIVGIVRDNKHASVREPAPPIAFVSLWQPLDDIPRISLAVASPQPQGALVAAIAQRVHGLRPGTLVADVITVDDQIEATLLSERLMWTLATGFAALALILAAVGLYGTLSYAVARRRAELAIRLALGAAPRRLIAEVFREVGLQVGLGLVLGLPLAWLAAQAAEGLLFGVSPRGPLSYLVGVTVLVAVAGLATWLPARRAATIQPAEALR